MNIMFSVRHFRFELHFFDFIPIGVEVSVADRPIDDAFCLIDSEPYDGEVIKSPTWTHSVSYIQL